MGCSSSHRTSQTGGEGKLSVGTASLLESPLDATASDSLREQLSTIFEARECAYSLRVENLDVVLLGPCATRVAEASVKLNATRRRPPSNSSTTEGIKKEYYLFGMPQVAPRYLKMRGASRGRDPNESKDEILYFDQSFSLSSSEASPSAMCSEGSQRSPRKMFDAMSSEESPRKKFENKTSEESTASGKSHRKHTMGYGHKFKCCVQIEDVQVTLRLWPVESLGDVMPTFQKEKYGKLAYLGLVPIDDDPDSTWSVLSQRLDEVRYFAKVQGVTEARLGCVPLLNNHAETSVAVVSERLKNFASQCSSMGLLDLMNGGAPVPLADTAFLFDTVVCRAAEWILEM